MREHQIVINLKRDQFEEVQRLARLAGSKSVSAYLKERVLELLAPDAEPEPQGGPTLEEMLDIDHELSRMHRELQVFIAESLSNSIYSGDDELQNEFDPDDFDQTFAAFQEMERNMEEEIERMSSTPATRSGGTTRSQQSDTISNKPVAPSALNGPQAFKRGESQRAGTAHRNQAPGSRRSIPVTPRDQSELDSDQDYPITGFPLAAENILDASAEIPGMVEDEPIVLPPTPGANRNRSNQRIRIIPTTPPPTAEEQAAHWKAQQPPTPAQKESGKNDSLNDSQNRASKTPDAGSASGKTPATPTNTGVPDALPPSEWSGHPISNFVESAGIYTNTSTESIWFTPPTQVLRPGLQPENATVENSSGSVTEAHDPLETNELPEPDASDTASGATTEISQNTHSTAYSGTTKTEDQPHSPFEQPNDELEDLAERAFAISPRLGTFDSSPNTPAGIRKRLVADPLDELIDGNILEEAQRLRASNQMPSSPYDDGVVYAFGGPDETRPEFPPEGRANPSSLPPHKSDEQRALLVGATDAGNEIQTLYDATTQAEAQPASSSEAPLEAQSVSDPNMSFETQSTSGSLPAVRGTEDEPLQQSDSAGHAQSSENTPPSSAPSPDPSVLGGPPPKRKRTMDDSTSGDDDEIISGGPPPKRRKK